jgi:hypothetical protein
MRFVVLRPDTNEFEEAVALGSTIGKRRSVLGSGGSGVSSVADVVAFTTAYKDTADLVDHIEYFVQYFAVGHSKGTFDAVGVYDDIDDNDGAPILLGLLAWYHDPAATARAGYVGGINCLHTPDDDVFAAFSEWYLAHGNLERSLQRRSNSGVEVAHLLPDEKDDVEPRMRLGVCYRWCCFCCWESISPAYALLFALRDAPIQEEGDDSGHFLST